MAGILLPAGASLKAALQYSIARILLGERRIAVREGSPVSASNAASRAAGKLKPSFSFSCRTLLNRSLSLFRIRAIRISTDTSGHSLPNAMQSTLPSELKSFTPAAANISAEAVA